MAVGGQSKPFFAGPLKLASVDDLDAFVARAAPGEEFSYCEAPDLVRGATSARVAELVREELVRSHQRRRQGGGFDYFVVRTRKAQERPPSPADRALADPFTETIHREVKRAANLALRCPSDAELARKAGLMTRAQAQQRFQKLIAVGLIESVVVYENGVPYRVVTIPETGKRTALPPKWAALQAAAAADAHSTGRGK